MTSSPFTCTEFKETLRGDIRSYSCEMIRYSHSKAILRYILPEEITVGGLILPAATVTYAFYWPDKPFTLYKWYDPLGRKLADYFNIADRVKIGKHAVRWRDLVIDLMCLPDGSVLILDEDEIPADIDRKLKRRIMRAKENLLSDLTLEIDQTDHMISDILSK